jgi:hypothetical protein
MAFWRLDRRVLWRNSNSIRSSFREGRGGLCASKERFDSAPPTRKGRPESRPHACARTNFPILVATDARSPSLFGIRLPGYCLPLLFHKPLTVHRCLEASDTVVGESAPHGHQCSEPERCVARRFLVPAKGCEAPKHLLAHTSSVPSASSRRASHEPLVDHLALIMDAEGSCLWQLSSVCNSSVSLASPCSSTSLAT